jgi:hypothetical protein
VVTFINVINESPVIGGGGGVRPAITLQRGVSIASGRGVEGEPYQLRLSVEGKDDEAKTYWFFGEEKDQVFTITKDRVDETVQNVYALEAYTPNINVLIPIETIIKDLRLQEDEKLLLELSQEQDSVKEAIKEKLEEMVSDRVAISDLSEFTLTKIDEKGNQEQIREFSTPLKITIKNIEGFSDLSKTAVYNVIPEYDQEGKIIGVQTIYSEGEVIGNDITFYTDHFSFCFYMVMERQATFSDMTNSWA